MKPTIRDVAQKANVSVSTVSALLTKRLCYEETKELVGKIIDELGYSKPACSKFTQVVAQNCRCYCSHIGLSFYGALLEDRNSSSNLWL